MLTIGTIQGGTRANIVADSVHMAGTIRTYDEKIRAQMHRDVRRTAENIAKSANAQASVSITKTYDVTVNDEALTERMVPVLMRAADDNVAQAPLAGASEDFSFFAQQAPGLYVFLGVTPRDQDPAKAAPNHNPRFFVDESALVVGTRTLGLSGREFPRLCTLRKTSSGKTRGPLFKKIPKSRYSSLVLSSCLRNKCGFLRINFLTPSAIKEYRPVLV